MRLGSAVLWLLSYHCLHCPHSMFCPLFALNLFILLSLLFLTHSFDLPPLTPRTHTLHIMNIHLSVCLNLSLPEFEEDSVYISVCVLTVSCIFEDEQI